MFRRALLGLTAAAIVWAIALRVLGPLAVTVAGVRLSSSSAGRPLLVAAVAATLYVLLSGVARTRSELAAARVRVTPKRTATLLAGVVLIVGLANNSWTAGGPDSYAYVTQADLLLQGRLTVPAPLAARAPWPDALTTLTPFGYRALPHELAIAPATGPGLPLLMAAFKRALGHPGAFLVVPFTGALLVYATFLVGSRVHSPIAGVGAAWLVATSPTFLMMFKSQMSDVPAAAFWTLAACAALRLAPLAQGGAVIPTTRAAVTSGVAAGMAILIRPNLVPLAAVLFAWLAWRGVVERGRVRLSALRPAVVFAAATLPACLAIAALNARLYGSPLSSGYGDLGQLFSIANVPTTLARYGGWFAETQTPLAFVGLILLVIAPRSLWSAAPLRASARLMAAIALMTWALYSVYQSFGAWWFLRFLLPSWPALCIATVMFVIWIFGRFQSGPRIAAVVVVALGIHGLFVTSQRGVFLADEGERRYATIATFVQRLTDPQAMILASIHAGPTRYYAGRATLRFDLLAPPWLDRAAEWLRHQGRHPYLLVEDWEMPMFTERFAGSRLGDLGASPMLAYRAYNTSGTVYLFDLLRREGPTLAPAPINDPRPRCPLPAIPPEL